MEVQELVSRVNELHSAQCNMESKVESVLSMQHKILDKLQSIDDKLSAQTTSSYPPPTSFSHYPPSTPCSSKTFPHHSTPCHSSPIPIHSALQLPNTQCVDVYPPKSAVPPVQPPPISTVQDKSLTNPNTSSDTLPEPKPILFSGEALPSSQVPKHNLCDPEEIARKYAYKANDASYTQFALKLAHHAYFGPTLLKQCTVLGERGRLGLPRAELSALKVRIFRIFPRYWDDRDRFEPLWNRCVDAINGACRRLRKAQE